MTPLESIETINFDGTKSKSVTIKAEVSTDMYVCIASHIPGYDIELSTKTTVRIVHEVKAPDEPITTERIDAPESNGSKKNTFPITHRK